MSAPSSSSTDTDQVLARLIEFVKMQRQQDHEARMAADSQIQDIHRAMYVGNGKQPIVHRLDETSKAVDRLSGEMQHVSDQVTDLSKSVGTYQRQLDPILKEREEQHEDSRRVRVSVKSGAVVKLFPWVLSIGQAAYLAYLAIGNGAGG